MGGFDASRDLFNSSIYVTQILQRNEKTFSILMIFIKIFIIALLKYRIQQKIQ